MRVLICSATAFEIAPLENFLKTNFIQAGNFKYRLGQLQVDLLISGVGLPITAYSLGKVLVQQQYDFAINAGIAGAIDPNLNIGAVVQVAQETFADLGVEEANGQYTSVFDLNLIDPNQHPFHKSQLVNPGASVAQFLPSVNSISVNKVHGFAPSIEALRKNFPDAQIENMEGAAFFYACLVEDLKFIEIRAISNYVEERNRENWDIPTAINNLNQTLMEMIKGLARP